MSRSEAYAMLWTGAGIGCTSLVNTLAMMQGEAVMLTYVFGLFIMAWPCWYWRVGGAL